MEINPPEYINKIKAYKAGKPIEELERQYGVKNAVKLASNENPFGPSPYALKEIEKSLLKLHRYPDSGGYELRKKLSDKLDISMDSIVTGNGSDDIIALLCKAFLREGRKVIMPDPGFLMYEISTLSEGGIPVKIPLKDFCIDLDKIAESADENTSLIFITNPNNPTGSFITKDRLENFIEKIPENIIVAVDEAYMEFADEPYNSHLLMERYSNIVSMRTFSKAYGLAGLRIGYGLMPSYMAKVLNKIRQPFNTSSSAQVGAAAALDDSDFLSKTRKLILSEKKFLKYGLNELGFTVYDTQANFIFAGIDQPADEIYEKLLYKGVIARSMSAYGYPLHLRFTIGLEEENRLLIKSLKEVL
ncbi:MAG: histidinol-phosphate transaminase [Thermodesulfobacteriota bacterium]